jgi:maltose alpha-D-glucosyltransferase/alpha-amylase
MALLGRRVAEMHRALAKATGDSAFDPEPATDADLAEWRSEALREVDAAIEALGAESENGRRLAARRDALRRRRCGRAQLRRWPGAQSPNPLSRRPASRPGPRRQDDFIIVDFEGEPNRPLERRRRKSCVLRDVAGMLRSFSYAAHAASLRRDPASSGGDAPTLARALADWERDASRHFLEGYVKAASGLASVPADPEAFRGLVELFLIEKAAYELRYEIAHRPEWIEIPLRGLLERVKP